MTIRIHATGEEHYMPEDRRTLHATLGRGNTLKTEVFLEYVDPEMDDDLPLGWFTLESLQHLINAAQQHYQNGTLPQ